MVDTYSQIVQEINRLKGKELSDKELHEVFNEFIYTRIPDDKILQHMKGARNKLITLTLPDGLNVPAINEQTLKILGIMEICEDWEQFENIQKKKKPKKELTDFDKILKGLSNVPKPPKDKPSE